MFLFHKIVYCLDFLGEEVFFINQFIVNWNCSFDDSTNNTLLGSLRWDVASGTVTKTHFHTWKLMIAKNIYI